MCGLYFSSVVYFYPVFPVFKLFVCTCSSMSCSTIYKGYDEKIKREKAKERTVLLGQIPDNKTVMTPRVPDKLL